MKRTLAITLAVISAMSVCVYADMDYVQMSQSVCATGVATKATVSETVVDGFLESLWIDLTYTATPSVIVSVYTVSNTITPEILIYVGTNAADGNVYPVVVEQAMGSAAELASYRKLALKSTALKTTTTASNLTNTQILVKGIYSKSP